MSEECREVCQVIGSQGVVVPSINKAVRYGDMVAFTTTDYGPVNGRVFGKAVVSDETFLCVAGVLLDGRLLEFWVELEAIFAHVESSRVINAGPHAAVLFGDAFLEQVGTDISHWLDQVAAVQMEEACRKNQ